MKISKAIVAAVGAAVYAKKKLEETQTPLRKKSLTVWKNGGVTHKEIIRKPISEEEQTDAINSRIDEAVRRYKPMSERDSGETETEPEIVPVNFTFTQSEDDGDPGVSFERVFDHFNRLESSVGNDGEDAGESGKKAEDTAEEALSAVTATAVEENFDEQAGMPKQMLLEKGIMTSAPIANAVQELAEMPSVIQDNEEIEDVRLPVDESIFDLYASEPVEDAVKAFEETADSETEIDSEQNDTAAEEAVSEPVEDAVKAFEKIAEQEETADIETESEQNDTATEEAVSEPVEDAVKAFEEIAEQEETADSEAESKQNDTATEEPVSEPVEDAVKAFEEIAEQEETADIETESEQNETATEEAVSEPVEDAVKAFEEIAEQEETADSEIDDEQNDTATEEAVSESVEDAVKAFEEIAQQEETADSEIESEQNDTATEEAVSEPVEDAVKAFEKIAQQEETADSEIDDEQNDIATEEAVSEPVEDAVKALEKIAEQEETADSEVDDKQNDTVTEEAVSEPVEDAVKALEEIAQQEETADSETESEQNDTATEEAVSEPVEDAVKALEEIAEQEETADSETESVQNDTATEEAVSEPVEDAVKALEEIAEQEETADSETESAQNDTATEEAISEPVEDAVKAFEEIAQQDETADSEEKSLEEQFHTIMAEETASDPVSSVRTAESVEDALKEFGDFIGISEIADSTGGTGSTEDISDDDLEQTSGIFEESTLSDELSETPDEPIDADEKPRTMDFFDLPDEAYTPVQLTEEKHDENVAEVEDLFGNLLMDDEPEVKKTFNDPSEVFSLFDTADGGQDDFDKYSDEKIEEENEKKKTSDTRKYIAQDIADNIASFAQLLEPLNAIKENKIRSKSGILFDWEMRIQALIGDLPIKTYWRNNFRNYEIWSDEKCMEKAGELLSMLELVGIVRDKAKEVVIDKDTLDFYSAQSEHLNNDFHIGETVVVTRPCWKINGHPARKGEIAKKAPFAEFSRKKVSPLETMLRENSCSDGDVNIPVTEDNFCTYDRDIPYVKRAIAEGFCKCAVRRMEDGGALAFFYEVIAEGENVHYSPCTLRFEVNIDKNANVVGRFRSEKV